MPGVHDIFRQYFMIESIYVLLVEFHVLIINTNRLHPVIFLHYLHATQRLAYGTI